MALQEQIKKDLVEAIKGKNEEKKEAIRVILGEFSRAEQKTLSDDQVIKILQRLRKLELEVLEKKQSAEQSVFLAVVDSYLPRLATEEEIRVWIKQNIDLGQYKNKMQAMRPIMQHFGVRADGNVVREILKTF